MTRVGMLGLGEMGETIALRLTAMGADVVAFDPVHPPSLDASPRLRWADSPRQVAAACDTILVVVADDGQVREVLAGDEGIIHAAGERTVVVVHSTVDPSTVTQAAQILGSVGAHLLDAGMSRGNGRMIEGSLTLFVGGEPAVVDQVRTVFDLYSDNLVHAGPTGAGMALKLCNNLVLHGNRMILHEAAQLGRAAGVSVEALVAGVRTSTGASWVAHHWGRTDDAALDTGVGDTPMVRRTTRELSLARDLAKRTRISLPMAAEVASRLPRQLALGAAGTTLENPVATNRRAISGFRADPSAHPEWLLLTTTGAITGLPRTSPLRYMKDADRIIVFAAGGDSPRHPNWYHNLRANPPATIEIGTATLTVTAVELLGTERDDVFARQAQLRPEFGRHQTRVDRTIPVIWLQPCNRQPAATS